MTPTLRFARKTRALRPGYARVALALVVSSGVSRRLGLVAGNSSADFKVDWAVANGQGIALTATPIGGRGVAGSGSLNVSPGQVVEFKIGSVLRQTTAMVHDP